VVVVLKKAGNVGQHAREKPAPEGKVDVLGTLIGMIGQDATLKIVEAFGGRRLSIPRYPDGEPGRRLTEIIGLDGVKAIIERFGGDYLLIPHAKPWRAQLPREAGWRYGEIAHALGTSETFVWLWLKERGMTQAKGARVGDELQSRGILP
jgi:hypothetical protein